MKILLILGMLFSFSPYVDIKANKLYHRLHDECFHHFGLFKATLINDPMHEPTLNY